MTQRKKRAPATKGRPSEARSCLADNVKRLLEAAGNPSPAKWGAEAMIGRKTAERLVNPFVDQSPTLETLDRVAEYFQVRTWELVRRNPLAATAAPKKREKSF